MVIFEPEYECGITKNVVGYQLKGKQYLTARTAPSAVLLDAIVFAV
jgi:hypothetical protein